MHYSKTFRILVIIVIILILTPFMLYYGYFVYFHREPVNIKVAFLSHYLAPDFISFKNLVNKWNPYFQKMGFHVNILDIDRESALQFLLSSQNSSIDIVVVSNFNFKKLVQYLTPLGLNQLNERFYEKAVHPFYQNGQVYAIPFHASFPILFYDRTYITDIPKSFNQLLTLAKNLSKAHNPESFTEYGLAIYSLQGKHSALVFQSLYETFGGHVLVTNSTVKLLSNQTLESLLNIYRLLIEEEISPPETLYYEFSVLNAEFIKKKFPLMIQWNYAIPFLSKNFTRDELGISSLPSDFQSSTSIGYVLAFGVCKFSKNKNYSIKFLESIYLNDFIKELVGIGAFPPIKGLSNLFDNILIENEEKIFH
ncbi:MAG: extracellular solute-binding protein [Nitrososphaeria archaeon]|nr:extracellular solute-binding protein [Nitrososphaeria archaeon]